MKIRRVEMEQKELFSREKLLKLILPLVVEQLLSVTVGMADMIMVSGAGEAAVSGISLVNTICVLLIMMFSASYAYAYYNYGDSYLFIRSQALFAVLGIAAMFAISFFDYHNIY